MVDTQLKPKPKPKPVPAAGDGDAQHDSYEWRLIGAAEAQRAKNRGLQLRSTRRGQEARIPPDWKLELVPVRIPLAYSFPFPSLSLEVFRFEPLT